MARVVLHGTLFLLSINLLTIALDQWEREIQLGPSRTRASFLTRELRACARASYRYHVGNGIRSLDWSIPVNFF